MSMKMLFDMNFLLSLTVKATAHLTSLSRTCLGMAQTFSMMSLSQAMK